MKFDVDEHSTPEHVAAYVRENLPKTTDLIYVDYQDRLAAEQIQSVFKSQEAMDNVRYTIDDVFSIIRTDNALRLIKDIVGEEAYEVLEEDDEELDDVRCLIEETDESDPMEDLQRSTPAMLIRYRLCDEWTDFQVDEPSVSENDLDDKSSVTRHAQIFGVPIDSIQVDAWNLPAKRTETAADKLAKMIGVPSPTFHRQINDLIENASYGGMPEIIWYAKPTDLFAHLKVADDDTNWVQNGTLTFVDPHILVINNLNGSGHDVRFDGLTLTVPFDPSRIVIDEAKSNGYSWDSIAGVVSSAYRTDVTYHPHDDQTATEDRLLVAA